MPKKLPLFYAALTARQMHMRKSILRLQGFVLKEYNSAGKFKKEERLLKQLHE